MAIIPIIAANIRKCRLKKGYSQEKLAELTGLHRTYIGSVERSERNISVNNLEIIANALEVEITQLFRDEI
jgi:transcriptional regulator with XRE-family HTH domain